MSDIYEDFWEAAQEAGAVSEGAFFKRCIYFGSNEEESVEELERLLRGEKTAVSHCIPYYLKTMQPLPKIGDYTLVTDFYGNPGAILYTKDVTLAAVGEISTELAEKELSGGYDAWLAWRQETNQNLAKQHKFPYTQDLGVLMEEIDRVYPIKKDRS